MPKEIAGGYNTNETEKSFTSHEKMTEQKFREIIESELGCSENIIEAWVKNLNEYLKNISEEINTEYNIAINSDGEDRDTRLVNADGTIMVESFQKSEGGPYAKEDDKFKKDKKKVKILEEKWHKEEREKNFGELWEKAITVILNKIIGTEFIVVRASKYDDYMNGIDTIIIDKETGNVVCAFDEVITEEGTEKEAGKFEKVEEKNKKGGTTIKYGITVNEENKIIKKEINNIPVFCLRLSGRDLVNTLNKMNLKNKEISEIEMDVFNNLNNSLKEQLAELKNKNIVKDAMKNNLDGFEYSLKKWKVNR